MKFKNYLSEYNRYDQQNHPDEFEQSRKMGLRKTKDTEEFFEIIRGIQKNCKPFLKLLKQSDIR